MQVDLEVANFARIKGKKPWSRISWLGKEREDIILFGKKKINVLDISSGNTKQLLQLQSFAKDIVVSTVSSTGSYLAGLVESGDIFLWHKDTEKVCWVERLPEANVLQLKKRVPCLFVSSNAQEIIIVTNFSNVYFWQQHAQKPTYSVGKKRVVVGCWSFVDKYHSVHLPRTENKEASIDSSFVFDDYLGNVCNTTFVFNLESNICISRCFITKTLPSLQTEVFYSSVPLEAKWSNTKISLKALCDSYEPIPRKGSYISKISHDGRVLAIIVNQLNMHSSKVLFLSLFAQSVICVDLQGCSTPHHIRNMRRDNWISDMVWTTDDAFLMCCTRKGFICLISKLGGLTVLNVTGSTASVGCSYYVPLLPFAIPTVREQGDLEPSNEDVSLSSNSIEQPWRQRFSLAVHHSLPQIIVSDGYMVVRLNFASSFFGISNVTTALISHSYRMVNSVFETTDSSTLQNFQGNLSSRLEDKMFSSISTEMLSMLKSLENSRMPMSNDQNCSIKNSQTEKNVSGNHAVKGHSDPALWKNVTTAVSTFSVSGWEERQISEGMNAILAAWGLAAASSSPWTKEMESLCSCAIQILLKIFHFVLTELICLGTFDSPLQFLEAVVKKFFYVLHFDCVQYNLLSCTFKFVYNLIKLLLSVMTNNMIPSIEVLLTTFRVLSGAEKTIEKVYSNTLMHKELPVYCRSLVKNNFLSSQSLQEKSIDGNVHIQNNAQSYHFCHSVNHCDTRVKPFFNQRFYQAWKLLYMQAISYYTSAVSSKAVVEVGKEAEELLCTIQRHLQKRGFRLSQTAIHRRVDKAALLYLKRKHSKAVKLWMNKLFSIKNEKEDNPTHGAISHIGHRILYCFILNGMLGKAVCFVYILLSSKNMYISWQSQDGANKKPCSIGIENSGVAKVVKSFARILAAYFCNKDIYVPPVLTARSITSLIKDEKKGCRMIHVDRKDITEQITKQQLDDVITPTAVIELLLIVGLWTEVIWFLLKLGAWQMAFCFGYLHSYLPESYKKRYPLRDDLSPEKIITEELKHILNFRKEIDHEGGVLVNCSTETMQEMQNLLVMNSLLLTSAICHLEVISCLLRELINELKGSLSDLTLLVDSDTHLPLPPLYCPQDICENSKEESFNKETVFRHRIASLVHSTTSLLKASNTAVPVICCYLLLVQKSTESLVGAKYQLFDLIGELKDELSKNYSFDIFRKSHGAQTFVYYFQSLCAILWMLHVRDNLAISFQKLQEYLFLPSRNRVFQKNSTCSLYEDILKWAVKLYPFKEFFQQDCLDHFIINITADMPLSERVCEYLSLVYTSPEMKHSRDVQRQLSELFDTLKTSMASTGAFDDDENRNSKYECRDDHFNSNCSLFPMLQEGLDNCTENEQKCTLYDNYLYHTKKQEEIKNYFCEVGQAYSENFSLPLAQLVKDVRISLYPFELDNLYMEYLEMFFDVSIFKHLDICPREQLNIPLLPEYADDLKRIKVSSSDAIYLKKIQNPFSCTMSQWKTYFLNKNDRVESKSRKSNHRASRSTKLSYLKAKHKKNYKIKLRLSNKHKTDPISTSQYKVSKNGNSESVPVWKSLSLISMSEENSTHEFISCLKVDSKGLRSEVDWLFHWAKTPYSFQKNDGVLQTRIDISPIDAIYALHVINNNGYSESNIIHTVSDITNSKQEKEIASEFCNASNGNDKRVDSAKVHDAFQPKHHSTLVTYNVPQQASSSLTESLKERFDELVNGKTSHTASQNNGYNFKESKIPQVNRNSAVISIAPDDISTKKRENSVLCTTLEKNLTSLKEQMNEWKRKRSATLFSVHNIMNADNTSVTRNVPLQENSSSDTSPSKEKSKSSSSQNSSPHHLRSSVPATSSQVGKFLSFPMVQIPQLSDSPLSQPATAVIKFASGEESSSTEGKEKASSRHDSTFSSSVEKQTPDKTDVISGRRELDSTACNNTNNVPSELSSLKTTVKIQHPSIAQQCKTSFHENQINESNYTTEISALSIREILTTTVQETFHHEIRTMAQQMGFGFLAGAIGCISVQSQKIQREQRYMSVDTQTEAPTTETNEVFVTGHKPIHCSVRHHPLEETEEHTFLNTPSDGKHNLKENSNLYHEQKAYSNSQDFPRKDASIQLQYDDKCTVNLDVHKRRKNDLISSHTTEMEEVDSGKEMTPDTLDGLSAVESMGASRSSDPHSSHGGNSALLFKKVQSSDLLTQFPLIQIQHKEQLVKNIKSNHLPLNHGDNLATSNTCPLLTLPKEEKSASSVEKHLNLVNYCKKKNEAKNRLPVISSMLPDLLKSSMKNKMKQSSPLLSCLEKSYGPLLFVEKEAKVPKLLKKTEQTKVKHVPVKYVQDYLLQQKKAAVANAITREKFADENLHKNLESKRKDEDNFVKQQCSSQAVNREDANTAKMQDPSPILKVEKSAQTLPSQFTPGSLIYFLPPNKEELVPEKNDPKAFSNFNQGKSSQPDVVKNTNVINSSAQTIHCDVKNISTLTDGLHHGGTKVQEIAVQTIEDLIIDFAVSKDAEKIQSFPEENDFIHEYKQPNGTLEESVLDCSTVAGKSGITDGSVNFPGNIQSGEPGSSANNELPAPSCEVKPVRLTKEMEESATANMEKEDGHVHLEKNDFNDDHPLGNNGRNELEEEKYRTDALTHRMLQVKLQNSKSNEEGEDFKMENTSTKAKETLGQKLALMQERLDEIEQASNTVKEELKNAEEKARSNLFPLGAERNPLRKQQLANFEIRKKNALVLLEELTAAQNNCNKVDVVEQTQRATRNANEKEQHRLKISWIECDHGKNLERANSNKRSTSDNSYKATRNCDSINALKYCSKETRTFPNSLKDTYPLDGNSKQSNLLRTRKIFPSALNDRQTVSENKSLGATFTKSNSKTYMTHNSKDGKQILGNTFTISSNKAIISEAERTNQELKEVNKKALLSLRRLYGSHRIPLLVQKKYLGTLTTKGSKQPDVTTGKNKSKICQFPMNLLPLARSGPANNEILNNTYLVKSSDIDKSAESDTISPWIVPDDVTRVLYSPDETLNEIHSNGTEMNSYTSFESSQSSDTSVQSSLPK